jgi:hypothetical protein
VCVVCVFVCLCVCACVCVHVYVCLCACVSVAAYQLRFSVGIPPGAWKFSVVDVVFCQGEVFATS